jgi:gliding motility-associated-like protein
MMNIRTIAILGIAFSGTLLAQTTSTSDCDGAIQLCGGTYTETSAPTGTGNVYEFTGTCNANLESESMWYTFTVQDAGNLSFVLDPASDIDDYDWGLFNITNGGCAGINAQDGSSPEVECNSYGLFGSNGNTGISTADGGSGTSNGPGDLNGPPFNADLPVAVGQTYALVVMNWTGSTNGYSIDFTQSTASIYDENPPSLVSVTTDCSNQTFHVEFSEPIIDSSVSATDFVLSTPTGEDFPFSTVTPDNPNTSSQLGYTLLLDGTISEGGTYTFTVTSASGNVQDLCGNIMVNTTFEVPIIAPVTYDVDVTTACNGTGGTVQANYVSGGTAPVNFYLQGSLLPNGSATGLGPGDYGLTVVDGANCQQTETVSIPNHDIEVLIPQEQDSLSCSTARVTIEGVEVVPAQDAQYVWTAVTASGTDPAFSTSTAPEVIYPGLYTVVVTDGESGCTDEASVEIRQTSLSTLNLSSVLLPNVVSPNGDGQNDVWRPYLPADPDVDVTPLFETYMLTIYDRWGHVIFDTGSDGRRYWNPKEVVDGTYFYKVIYKSNCGATVDKDVNGSITVLR